MPLPFSEGCRHNAFTQKEALSRFSIGILNVAEEAPGTILRADQQQKRTHKGRKENTHGRFCLFVKRHTWYYDNCEIC